MSDRNECAYCGGKGVGCHPVEPAPPAEALDQAVGLDFEAAEKSVHQTRLKNGIVFGHGHAESWDTYVKWSKDALNAQVRALLARKDERIKEMQEDITDIQLAESCRPHAISSTRLREAVRKLYRHLEVR